jgi:hypothetical protein
MSYGCARTHTQTTRTHTFLHYIAKSTYNAMWHYQTVWNLVNYTHCKIEHPDSEKGHYTRIPQQKWFRSKTIYVTSKPTSSLYRIWWTASCFGGVRVVAISAYYPHHVHPSGRMHRRGSHSTDFRKTGFILGTFMKICPDISNLVTIGQKNRVLYMITLALITVVGEINSPLKHFCATLSIFTLLTVTRNLAKHT